MDEHVRHVHKKIPGGRKVSMAVKSKIHSTLSSLLGNISRPRIYGEHPSPHSLIILWYRCCSRPRLCPRLEGNDRSLDMGNRSFDIFYRLTDVGKPLAQVYTRRLISAPGQDILLGRRQPRGASPTYCRPRLERRRCRVERSACSPCAPSDPLHLRLEHSIYSSHYFGYLLWVMHRCDVIQYSWVDVVAIFLGEVRRKDSSDCV